MSHLLLQLGVSSKKRVIHQHLGKKKIRDQIRRDTKDTIHTG